MTRRGFELNGLATAVGSMPHVDPQKACSLVLKYLPEIPAWPQLPKRSFKENMYVQYSESFPGIVVEDERIWVDRSRDLSKSLEHLYSAYLENRTDGCAMGQDYASGFYAFLKEVKRIKPMAVKGQVTGPISFGLAVTDQNRRPLLYDEVLADATAKHLRLKAAWQEKVLRSVSPRTIIFVDEPYLTSLGSAFVSFPKEQVVTLIEEVLGGISGLKGIHCCGNTDWSVLLQTSLDILNFDAYNYGESISLYPAEVKSFLAKGGVLAWGIVPNNEDNITKETPASLVDRLVETMGLLSNKGVNYETIKSQCLITPSCSLASMSPEAAASALETTARVSTEFRRKHIDPEIRIAK
jgi:methionine synthase II (cobalamin-independent)